VTPTQQAELTAQLARLGAGERACAQPVFEALWPALTAFCGRWLAGSSEAEDCAQRALTRVFAQAAAFDPKRDALAWALELAVWECRTARAQQRRSRTAPLAQAASARAADDPALEVERAELHAALAEALAGSAPSDREELAHLLGEQLAGDPASRKRRQRAVERLKLLWRRLHGAP
jgi:RNA polymerase sigma-70 factor (ECF subfamily)